MRLDAHFGQAADDALPPLKKAYSTKFFVCTCHRGVNIGEPMYIDEWNAKKLCAACGTVPSASNVVPITEPDERQRTLDRMHALGNLPGPLKPHLQSELDELKKACSSARAELLPAEGSSTNQWLKWMPAKYTGACSSCKTLQKVGSYVAYHKVKKTITCAACLE